MRASELFDLPESLSRFSDAFQPDSAPWEWVGNIGEALESVALEALPERQSAYPSGLSVTGPVYIHASVKLPGFGSIEGPAFIGPDCELRPGVYLRPRVIAGRGCVLGNSCEFKNSLLMDGVQVPHFSYVGDSVLGSGAHLGAGAILSNFRFDKQNISVKTPDGMRATGMRKLGGLLGDASEMGCNAVLQPGTILAKRSIVMTGLVYNGYLEANTLAYRRDTIQRVTRRDI